MLELNNVQTGDDYDDTTPEATISEVWASSGGFATVSIADAWVQLQYGTQGQTFWTNEVHVPQNSPLTLLSGTIGIRFRSYVAGTPATINAALAAEAEPPIIITNPGTVTVTPTGFVQLGMVVVPGGGGTATFATIPAGYTNLKIVWVAGANGAAETNVLMMFNNDAGANYDWSVMQAVNGASTPASAAGAAGGMIVGIAGTTGGFYGGEIVIPSYLSGIASHAAVGTYAGSVVDLRSGVAGGFWHMSQPVNRIDLTAGGGNFAPSSTFTLYGF